MASSQGGPYRSRANGIGITHKPLRIDLEIHQCYGIIGMIVGPVVVAPPKTFPSLVVTSLLGAVLLVVIGALLHWTTRGQESRK